MRIKALVFIAALAAPSLALADDPAKPGPTASDRTGDPGKAKAARLSADDLNIVAHQHHVHMMEIELGKLAQKQGGDAVKRYGQTLVSDHQAANQELTAMAKKKGITKIPKQKPTTEAEQKEHQDHKSSMARLQKLRGAEFDRPFLAMMVMDHDKEVSRADAAIASATDPELQAHLRNVKPVLQRHADTARELQRGGAQVSAGPGTPSNPPAN